MASAHPNTPQRPLGPHQTREGASLLRSGVTLGKDSHLKPRHIFSELGKPSKRTRKGCLISTFRQIVQAAQCHHNWEPSHQKCGRTRRQGEPQIRALGTEAAAQAGGPAATGPPWKTVAELSRRPKVLHPHPGHLPLLHFLHGDPQFTNPLGELYLHLRSTRGRKTPFHRSRHRGRQRRKARIHSKHISLWKALESGFRKVPPP